MSVKEKIWKGDFIDILSLLPFHKYFPFTSDRRGEDKQERDTLGTIKIWGGWGGIFRQKLAIHPKLRWGMKKVGLWLNLVLPETGHSLTECCCPHAGSI